MNNLTPSQINALLNMAGKQLGTDPNVLRRKLEQGGINDLTRNLNPKQLASLNQIMSNPQAMNSLLNSPQVKDLLQRLSGGR